MNILLLTFHSIAEHDDLQMFARMPGVEVFSIGAYTNAHRPSDDKRPPVLEATFHEALAEACEEQRRRHDGHPTDEVIDWAKGDLPDAVVDWADVVIVHHFPEMIFGRNWDKLQDKRVIWRTCGQSDPGVEDRMRVFRERGLEIVRYSPKEAPFFSRAGMFAGQDAVIRFGKDPSEWTGWTGSVQAVGNITQHMAQRGDACGYDAWREATMGLITRPAGPGSESMPGGIGALPYDAMKQYLRDVRCYFYTGTRPASYTLGLIEAMMTGTPVIAMPAVYFRPHELYEADEIVLGPAVFSAAGARSLLAQCLDEPHYAAKLGAAARARAIDLFGLEAVSAEWADYLGVGR